MAHGDERGLRLPPRIAPIQVAIVVVRDEDGAVDARARAGRRDRRGRRPGRRSTTRSHAGFGRRAIDWELKGVPVRIDLGPRDLAEGQATIARRDQEERSQAPLTELASLVPDLLGRDAGRDARRGDPASASPPRVEVETIAEAAEAGQQGVAKIAWEKLGTEGEEQLLQDGVSVRCLQRPDGTVPAADDDPDLVAIVARAY